MNFKPVHILIIAFIAVNAINFCQYGIDKCKAIKDRQRIPERRLLWWSVFAPFGGYAGMLFFRHKTKKFRFQLLHLVMCLAHFAAFAAVLYYF